MTCTNSGSSTSEPSSSTCNPCRPCVCWAGEGSSERRRFRYCRRTMAMNRADRRRQIKDDEQKLRNGIEADSSDPAGTAAMTRLMSDLLETAKRDRNIEPPVRFLHAKVDATLHAMRKIPVDCKKACAHCCRVWVSATIPEVLFLAKSLRRRNDLVLAER